MENKKCNLCSNKCSQSYSSPRISSEYKDCSLPLTFDQYNICGYGFGKGCTGCIYCFSNAQKFVNPAYKGHFQLKSVNPKGIINQISGKRKTPYYENFFKHRFPLHWGGLAEPFCPIERKKGIGLEILKYTSDIEYPLIFSTNHSLNSSSLVEEIMSLKSSLYLAESQIYFALQFG